MTTPDESGSESKSDFTDDDGFGAIWILAAIPGVVVVFMVAFGLWSGYNARQQLAELAEASARSGANAIDEEQFYSTGELGLDRDLAVQLAAETLALQPNRALVDGGSVDVVDGQVVVEVRGAVNLILLGPVPIGVTATAEPRVDDGDA